MSRPWPVELRLNPAGDVLAVSFDDGMMSTTPTEDAHVSQGPYGDL
jgi:DUF971 family protein